MIKPFIRCESRPTKLLVSKERFKYSPEVSEVLVSFWENAKGERIGFATNWRRESSDLKITRSNGQTENRHLAPLETIELTVECIGENVKGVDETSAATYSKSHVDVARPL